MKISYVCTNFNKSAFTLAAVDSLLRNAGHDIRIVVVENASREEEVEKLRPMPDRDLRVEVERKENLGISAASTPDWLHCVSILEILTGGGGE